MLRNGRGYHTLSAVYVYFEGMSPKLSLLCCVLLIGCNHKEPAEPSQPVKSNATTRPTTAPVAAKGERSLFDGKTLTNWQTAEFGAHGEPYVKDGSIILPVGEPMTGVTWTGGPIPKMNYEVTWECQRLDGSDFFGTLTFPFSNSFASLVIGGWGGGLCGISSLDGGDAANNPTGTNKNFENKHWYSVRLRITPDRM